MPSQKATDLAKQILDDFQGAAFYADPELLGEVLKDYLGPAGKPSDALTVILRQLLRKYKTQYAVEKDQDVEELAELIEGSMQ